MRLDRRGSLLVAVTVLLCCTTEPVALVESFVVPGLESQTIAWPAVSVTLTAVPLGHLGARINRPIRVTFSDTTWLRVTPESDTTALLTGVRSGFHDVTISAGAGATTKVPVLVPDQILSTSLSGPSGSTLGPSGRLDAAIAIGSTVTLTLATIGPLDLTQNMTWTSIDTSIVSIAKDIPLRICDAVLPRPSGYVTIPGRCTEVHATGKRAGITFVVVQSPPQHMWGLPGVVYPAIPEGSRTVASAWAFVRGALDTTAVRSSDTVRVTVCVAGSPPC